MESEPRRDNEADGPNGGNRRELKMVVGIVRLIDKCEKWGNTKLEN